jgi:(4-O-methyl)-D-glucuronate---lignin esterase
MRRAALTLCLLAIAAFGARILVAMQAPAANYDESKVPAYTLPDPLVLDNGGKVSSAKDWTSRRRELLARFAAIEYGQTPGTAQPVTAKVDEEGPAFGGSAMRRQLTLHFGAASAGLDMHLLLYVPAKATEPVPAFLALNFQGNQAIADDPAITLATAWLPDRDKGVVDHRATDAARGTEASRFPIDLLVSHGYALATAYYGDLDPDFDDGFQNGVHPLFYRPGQSRPAPGEWGAIGAWAWGLSRALDYLEKEQVLDARKVALVGHSRLGKAALWAGAQDDRFAIVISNESGSGGAALHKRIYGETVEAITRQFPHWFTPGFQQYAGHEERLPIDQHELLALIAPRPLYVASAAGDQWADPRGEFLSAKAADPVYRLLGTDGLGVADMPPVDHPVGGTIGYHVRSGEHDLTRYDWEQFVRFADRHFKR